MTTPYYYDYFIQGNNLRESCCRKLLEINNRVEYDEEYKEEVVRQYTYECVDDGIFDHKEHLYRGAMALSFREKYTMPSLWKAFQ